MLYSEVCYLKAISSNITKAELKPRSKNVACIANFGFNFKIHLQQILVSRVVPSAGRHPAQVYC